jgi:hypothetical protein
MVEVFCTNVNEPEQASQLISKLKAVLPDAVFNFDLDDCDRILRVENGNNSVQLVTDTLHANGFHCTPL